MAGITVRDYLKTAQNQTIPPLVLELILGSGRSFYIKNVFPFNDDAELIPLRVWDLRALSEADTQSVLMRINSIRDRSALENVGDLHPRLDQGNLWVRVADVEAIMEWHDRVWPSIEKPAERTTTVGFRPGEAP